MRISRHPAPRELSLVECHQILARHGITMHPEKHFLIIPADKELGIYLWGIIDKTSRRWRRSKHKTVAPKDDGSLAMAMV